VLGRELADVADTRQPLDQNRLVPVWFGDSLDLELVHTLLLRPLRLSARRYFPCGSVGENGAGALFVAGSPQTGQRSDSVYTGWSWSAAVQTRISAFMPSTVALGALAVVVCGPAVVGDDRAGAVGTRLEV
jgi:hypothetical protein